MIDDFERSQKRQAQLREMKDKLRQQLDVDKAKRARLVAPDPAPRYDDIFYEGQKWLDSIAGNQIEPAGEDAIDDVD
jgi:hypothetical protein